MDNLTAQQRKKNMKNIKSKNTKPELLLRKALWNRGFRYRLYGKDIFGNPDIYLKGKRIAIFIDSDFWHGKQLFPIILCFLEVNSKLRDS